MTCAAVAAVTSGSDGRRSDFGGADIYVMRRRENCARNAPGGKRWTARHIAELSARTGADAGSAVVEFVFAAVLMMVPLVYLVVTVATVQQAQLAVTNAARDAGRAFATGKNVDDALARARIAARIAFDDAHYGATPVVHYVAADATSCAGPAQQPSLQAGADFTVCVDRQLAPPAVPGFLHFHPISVQSMYRVHIDDFRST